jgi:hypothetical protein
MQCSNITPSRISFDCQVQNLLSQHDSPFQRDPNFAYICWNIIKKRAVNRQATFRANVNVHSNISKELREVALHLTSMVSKWRENPHAVASTKQEKKAIRTLNNLNLVAKELCRYKQCRRNEICAFMNRYSTLALFVTLNPSDVNNPLVTVMAGMNSDEWRGMSFHEQAMFLALNPGPAAQFFDYSIKGFGDVILQCGDPDGGLFGHCKAYYGMVEAQGRGTLNCHMLIWLDRNPSPQVLRDRMAADPSFKQDTFTWLESIIKCELPGMTGKIVETKGELKHPDLPPGLIDPRLAAGQILTENNEDEFVKEFTTFVSELAIACNWHKHTFTC